METKTIKTKPSIDLILCIFFLVAFAVSDVNTIILGIAWSISEGHLIDFLEITLSFLAPLFLAVALFRNGSEECRATKIGASMVLVHDLLSTIMFYHLDSLLFLLASALVFLPIIIKNKASMGLCIVSVIITFLLMIGTFLGICDNIATTVGMLMLTGAYIMIGRVLRKPREQKTEIDKAPIKEEKNEDFSESLTKLKNLLDNGVITQEEFEVKKKQILGL